MQQDVAQVVVWDFERREPLFKLKGVDGSVGSVAFSDDDRFLAATGEGSFVAIWDMQTGMVAQFFKNDRPAKLLMWGATTIAESNRRTKLSKYSLLSFHNNGVLLHSIDYDIRSMQYVVTSLPFRFPSSGLNREYLAAVRSCNENEILCGTAAGELVVLGEDTKTYRASLPVSSNGLSALLVVGNCILAGAGDGVLRKLQGKDLYWSVVGEVALAGRVVSATLAIDRTTAYIGTTSGRLYAVDVESLQAVIIAENPSRPAVAVGFGARSDVFYSVAADGSVRGWDLGDYSTTMRGSTGKTGSCIHVTKGAPLQAAAGL